MVIATTFPYDTSDDDTESGQGESTGAAPPTFNGGLSAPGDMSAVAKMAQEFSEEISNGPVWDRNGFLNGKTTTPASNHTIATMPTCAYGMRHLYQKEELSTDEQSCGDPTWEDNPKDSKTVPQFRIYKKSGRRKRRARRKKICLAITLLGLLIVIISISVGVANKRSSNKPSSSKYSAVSASKSRDPAGQLQTLAPTAGQSQTLAPVLSPISIPLTPRPISNPPWPRLTNRPTYFTNLLSLHFPQQKFIIPVISCRQGYLKQLFWRPTDS